MNTPSTLAQIPLDQIAPSLTNPRKTFHAGKLVELADDIKRRGIDTPVTVRPLPGARVGDTDRGVQYELVCGERRYRASEQAGLRTIPAIVRALTDEQALEIQLCENLKRDDLTELEEAEGYQTLMQHANINADQVAERIGKSRSYVYGRTKLLALGQEAKQALRDGGIDASRALLIARIPDGKLQIKALEWASKPGEYTGELPSVRQLTEWLQSNVMLKLKDATFKITDARLLPDAGSCTDCPKRTGANPDLFSDVKSADICTDPPCYHSKTDAHREAIMQKAQARGLQIVQGKEATEMLGGNQYRSQPEDYSLLHEPRLDLTPEGERPLTLAQALGKDAPTPILFVHPRTQEHMELVPTSQVLAALRAKGLERPDEPVVIARGDDPQETLNDLLERMQKIIDKQSDQALRNAAINAVHTSTAEQAQQLTNDMLRAFLLWEQSSTDPFDMAETIGFEIPDGGDEDEALTQHIQRLDSTGLLRAAISVLLANTWAYDPTFMRVVVKHLDIDVKPLQRKATAEVKAKFAYMIKDLQAQIAAKQAPPPTASAAQSKRVAPASARPAKLTPEQAKSGIAAAMQGLEGSTAAPEGAVASPGAAPPDPLLQSAINLVTREQKATVRLLKTELKVGTTKALEIMDKLQATGTVSAVGADGVRKVMVAV